MLCVGFMVGSGVGCGVIVLWFRLDVLSVGVELGCFGEIVRK